MDWLIAIAGGLGGAATAVVGSAVGPRYACVLVGRCSCVLDPRTGTTVCVLATRRPRLLLSG